MRNLVNNTTLELLTNYELMEINGGWIFIPDWYVEFLQAEVTLLAGITTGLLSGFIDASEYY